MTKNDPNKNFAAYESDREAKRKAQSVQAGERTQHSSGPWRVRAVRGAAGQSKAVWVQQEQIGAIARIYAGVRVLERPAPSVDEVNAIKDANARLIAAAPELLEALKSVVHDLQWGTTKRWKGEGSAPLVSAIAKAEGRAY